jgi:hypothetical protein
VQREEERSYFCSRRCLLQFQGLTH